MQQRPAVLSVKKAAAPRLTLADVISQVAGDPALLSAVRSVATERIVTLEGIWPGAVAPVLAAWIQQQQKPLLILCAHVAESESLAAELGELSAVARVEVLPPGSEDHEFESLQHQERLSACMCSAGSISLRTIKRRPRSTLRFPLS